MGKNNLKFAILLSTILFFIFIAVLIFHHYKSFSYSNDSIFDKSRNNESYSSTTTEQGERVVDSSTGFSFLLPRDWEIEKISRTMVILAFSSSTYAKENPESRCKIVFQSSKLSPQQHYNLDDIKDIIQEKIAQTYPKATNLVFATATIGNNTALETSFEFRNANSFDRFIITDVFSKGNLFDFSGLFLNLGNEKQGVLCQKGMEQILKTISTKG